ncbi:hypothetical protein BLNAU_20523 [Blattamonas nauphoetae]|uniref:Uncharacterized protein n=1 Tax=Blattamonas nauphoetae TaxID=2049346 RepID=A0ABQ9WYH9_9EUKA|nr:hypothetical protein BLNAU_20523 [Blattamonas nauphoetae]
MCHEFTGTNATLWIGIERLKSEPVFKSTNNMTIHHLAIVAPQSITGDVECHPLIKTTKAHLTVDSVTFQQSSFAGAINVIFLEATKSNIDLVDCAFQHIKTQVVLLKVSVESGNTVNMAGITFSDIDLSVTQNISLVTVGRNVEEFVTRHVKRKTVELHFSSKRKKVSNLCLSHVSTFDYLSKFSFIIPYQDFYIIVEHILQLFS